MQPFWKTFTCWLATGGAVFHFLFAMVPFITASPENWGPAVALCHLDYPVFLLFQVTGLYDNRFNDVWGGWLYGFFGTAMYAALGALAGYAIDRLRRRKQLGTP